MNLVEKQIIKPTDSRYRTLLGETRKSKDLRNVALFVNRQHYSARHDRDFIEDIASDIDRDYISWITLGKLLKDHPAYKAMLANAALQTLKMVDQEYLSFFGLVKLKSQGLYEEKVRPPKYSEKNGYYPVVYNGNQLSQKYIEQGLIKIPKTDVVISGFSHVLHITQLRVVPKNGYIVVEALYKVPDEPIKEDNERYASIDIGVNNLAAVYSNVADALLISGKPLKAINLYYNKKVSKYQSLLAENNNKVINDVTGKEQKQHASHVTQFLAMKRSNKISDYLHKASSQIVQYLVSNEINTLIVGNNKGWKQSNRMRHGSKEMQSFQSIPFSNFIFMLQYKCNLVGIRVILQEESYTSKASAFDGDYIPKFDKTMPKEERVKQATFSGKRVKRGLYKTKNGILVNADINGAANVLRKYLQEVCDANKTDAHKASEPADIGYVMNPSLVRVLFQEIKCGSKARMRRRDAKRQHTCEKNQKQTVKS